MAEIILDQFEHRRTVRRIEQHHGIVYIECLQCHHLKPKTAFPKNNAMLLGRGTICRDCVNIRSRRRATRIRARRELFAVC